MSNLTKFLPSYVGSKACWVKALEQYRGRDFVEFFAGSGVISANLANRAVLNDNDPFLHRYFRQYESQPIVETFTNRNYFTKRRQKSWYRWLYYLQKMSFSGVSAAISSMTASRTVSSSTGTPFNQAWNSFP